MGSARKLMAANVAILLLLIALALCGSGDALANPRDDTLSTKMKFGTFDGNQLLLTLPEFQNGYIMGAWDTLTVVLAEFYSIISEQADIHGVDLDDHEFGEEAWQTLSAGLRLFLDRLMRASLGLPPNVTPLQVIDISKKFLMENPELRHYGASTLVWRSLLQADW